MAGRHGRTPHGGQSRPSGGREAPNPAQAIYRVHKTLHPTIHVRSRELTLTMKANGKTIAIFPFTKPEDQGLDPNHLEKWQKRLQKEKVTSCLIIKNGHCVFEYYKNKKIESKPQKIHSVTKSIVSALVGICFDQELIPSLDTPILDFFPKYAELEQDPRKRSITVNHLLTMTPGYHWPEFGEWEAFSHMFYASNWVRFVLERELECDPGTRMNYNTGATHLLTAIVQRVSGMKASEFADKHLFKPLGITEYIWHEDPQGINNGGSGMMMHTLDMTKFGIMYLNEGRYGKKQIVSKEWVSNSMTPQFMTYENIGHYARHWWVGPLDREQPLEGANLFYFALGYGGQFIIVLPAYQMVAAITSELYESSLLPLSLFREHIVPALLRAGNGSSESV
ncbi:penicillin-binding protein [Brevibacillus brevis]|nr:penicillin-binding protein [Brevibacillus brevis]